MIMIKLFLYDDVKNNADLGGCYNILFDLHNY